MKRSVLAGLAASALVALVGSVARADDASDTATARALGTDGVALADAGRCREAVPKLERAEKLHHAPTTATRLAECEIALGRLVAGTERLQRVVREVLPPGAHPAFVAAVARAQRVLDANVSRIATLHLTVVAPADARLSVIVDEDALADPSSEIDRRLDPGAHAVRVTAPGFHASESAVTLAEGEVRSLSVELVSDGTVRAPAGTAYPLRDLGRPPEAESSGSRVPAVLAFAVGGAGLATGIAFGLMTSAKTRALDAGCGESRVCPDGYGDDIADAKRAATVSTVGFVAGGVGTIAGVVLLLAAPSRAHEPTRGVRVRPRIGLSSVGLDGRF